MDTAAVTTAPTTEEQRKVGVLLGIGILVVPIIFAWFLFRKGYSNLARAIGLGWMAFVMFSALGDSKSTPTPSAPEAVAAIETKPTVPKTAAPAQQPAKAAINNIAIDIREVAAIEGRLKENAKSLKRYYGTTDQLGQATKDALHLIMMKVEYQNQGKSKEEKALGQKVAALLPLVSEQVREIYASSVEENFMKNGLDMKVRALGKEKKQLRITYALMSQPLVYKFQNEIKVNEQASKLGFTKLVYTNGFESELGNTWTIDLKE